MCNLNPTRIPQDGTLERSPRMTHGMGKRQEDYGAEPSDWIGLLDRMKAKSPMHGYGYVEGKCRVMIPLTAGLTQETMAAALRNWVVINCGLDLNHQAVGHPAMATLLLMEDACKSKGCMLWGPLLPFFHTPRCNIAHNLPALP